MHKKILIILIGALLLTTMSPVMAKKKSSQKTDPNKTDTITEKYGFTIMEEREIGYQSAIMLAKKYGLVENDKVNKYINYVGKEVVDNVSTRPFVKYEFFVLDTPEVNAFATPGGFIFITSGALRLMSNEAELASVLGHEIGHVESGHGLEAIVSTPGLKEKLRVKKVELHESVMEVIKKKKNVDSGIVNAGNLPVSSDKITIDNGQIVIKDQ